MTNTQDGWKTRTMLFFVSQCITLFGSQIVQMAVVWYVTLQTKSGALIAAFSVCSYLPQFFIAFIGGVWADRYSRKTLIIGADLLIALVTLAMMLMMPHIEGETWMLAALLVMSVLRSVGAGIQQPAVNAVIPQLVKEEHLMRYNGINATMQSVVQFAAPAAAAAVLSSGTLRGALAVDIVTAAVGIGLFSLIRLPAQEKAQEKPSMLADVAAGARYAYGCRSVRAMLVVYGGFVFLTVPAGYLSGLLVSRAYGSAYGYLTATELVGFGGMMAGGFLMSVWGGFKSRRRTLALGLTLFGAMAIGMSVSRVFAVYLVFMGLYGVALTAVQTTVTTILQERTESAMQGRVFGLMGSLYASCYPFGMVLFGTMADSFSLRAIMVFSGAALIALAAIAYGHPHLREA